MPTFVGELFTPVIGLATGCKARQFTPETFSSSPVLHGDSADRRQSHSGKLRRAARDRKSTGARLLASGKLLSRLPRT